MTNSITIVSAVSARMTEVDIKAIRGRLEESRPKPTCEPGCEHIECAYAVACEMATYAFVKVARADVEALISEIDMHRAAMAEAEKSWNKEAERHERDHRDHYEEREALRASIVISHDATAKAINERSALEDALRHIIESNAGEFRNLARAALNVGALRASVGSHRRRKVESFQHEIRPTADSIAFLCTCGVIGERNEMDAHLAATTREEADAILAGVWTLVCLAEERDYTAEEIDEIIASCTEAFAKLKALSRTAAKNAEGPVDHKRPNRVDKHRIDHGDYVRASGDVTCKVCGHLYYDHPVVIGFEWLRRACDGRLLKL